MTTTPLRVPFRHLHAAVRRGDHRRRDGSRPTTAAPTTSRCSAAGAFLRPNPASPFALFQGHPERFVLTLPNNPVFVNTPVFFVWGTGAARGFQLSLPTGIRV